MDHNAPGIAARFGAGDRPTLLLENRPNDLQAQKQWTICLAGLMNDRAACAQATCVLGIDALWVEGYLLRAEAAAQRFGRNACGCWPTPGEPIRKTRIALKCKPGTC